MSQGKIAAVAPIMQASPAETPAPKLSEEQAKRLEELRTVREKREAAEAQAAEIRELEAEELALTLETQGGRRGEDFEVLTNRFGVFAITKPDTQAIRNWEKAVDAQKASLEWQIGILRHYIVPMDRQLVWAQTCATRPGLCWQTAEAFVDLMGIDRSRLEKKR